MNKLYRYIILGVSLLLFFQCTEPHEKERRALENEKKDSVQATPVVTYELIESHVDSVYVGKRKSTKVELLKYRVSSPEAYFILIHLYEKNKDQWELIYKDSISSGPLTYLHTECKDYNSDGFGDVSFCVNVGANLANPKYVVFIYTPTSKLLKQAGTGWNLEYSRELKMFRERYITPTMWVRFYTIHTDSLQKKFELNFEIASETVTEYNAKGEMIREYKSEYDEKSDTIPPVKHWIRAWAIKDSLN